MALLPWILLCIIILIFIFIGIIVHYSTMATYYTKSANSDIIQEQRFKIPIETEEGLIKLDARIVKSRYTPNPAPCVIVCHGWRSDLYGMKYLQDALALYGYAVVAYSSRGHGKSEGKSVFPAVLKDITKVLDYLQNESDFGIDQQRFAVIGHSMGGNIALIHAYLDDRVKAVVALSAIHDLSLARTVETKFFSKAYWAHLALRLSGLKLDLTPEFNRVISPKYYLNQPSNTQVFLIHAKDDPMVEFYNFENNVALLKLPEDHTLVFERGGHSLFRKECLITSQIIKWLDKSL